MATARPLPGQAVAPPRALLGRRTGPIGGGGQASACAGRCGGRVRRGGALRDGGPRGAVTGPTGGRAGRTAPLPAGGRLSAGASLRGGDSEVRRVRGAGGRRSAARGWPGASRRGCGWEGWVRKRRLRGCGLQSPLSAGAGEGEGDLASRRTPALL